VQSQSIHTPPPPPPPTGTPEEHALRIERAQRVCALLEESSNWRGRVGVVNDDVPPEDGVKIDAEEGDGSDSEDMFGSDPGSEPEAEVEESKKAVVVKEKEMTKEEMREVLKGLVGFMGKGPVAS
jgi:hypothetical protein